LTEDPSRSPLQVINKSEASKDSLDAEKRLKEVMSGKRQTPSPTASQRAGITPASRPSRWDAQLLRGSEGFEEGL